MSTTNFVSVIFALLLTACSARMTGPPDIVVDETACSHCRMLVSEPVYAAAYRVHGEEARVFDDIGCMLEAIQQDTAFPIEVWVQDAAGSGWLDAGAAVFVSSAEVRTPMSGGLLAYADAAAARSAATAHGGHVIPSLEQLMTWKGDAR